MKTDLTTFLSMIIKDDRMTSHHMLFTLRRGFLSILAMILFFAVPFDLQTQNLNPPKGSFKYDYALYKGMQWREIGPFRGGRSVAVAGHPDQLHTYYFGVTGGGVWKTTDGGITWLCISDSLFQTGSVGSIAVAESDPNVVYVGMGEACIRGNVSPGDGVYKSEDAGKSWKHIGLTETQTIGRVRVHPRNADIVYVAAFGNVFGPNTERGIYRSMDGGKSWKKILYKNDKTGAIDIILDPTNPRVIYAAMWEAQRGPYFMSSGGAGSALYKSVDGGDTWIDLSGKKGMPKGIKGRIGVAASAAKADRVWAMIEAEEGGLFRSEDGGETWRRVNEDRRLRQRAWYYTHVYADTKNPDMVYILNTGFYRSVDGGRTISSIRVPHGDNHDLWIDPNDNRRMINANDGGANVSYNQDHATAQFYHVFVDNQFPYHVYGAQQDNSTIAIASRTTGSSIGEKDWYVVGGGESGYVAVREDNPNVVFTGNYGGYLSKFNRATGQYKSVNVWPDNPMGSGAEGMKYRFQWTFPIVHSPYDPSVLYAAGNHLFKSTNDGMNWEMISPDLTRNDKSKIGSSGGPITKDNTSVEYYCTIFSFAESPVKRGVLWVGTDDGLLHVSQNGGASWQNISIGTKDLPEWSLISILEASPHDAGTAYIAATRYKENDFRPYLFKTTNYGKNWKRIVKGIPEMEFTRVIREDPYRKGLLYSATERGVYVSFDDGENWQSLQMNLPVSPIHDLVIQKREKDIAVATHGRSFWILDDLTPLHQINDAVSKASVHLFQPRHTYRMRGGSFSMPGVSLGKNPPSGAIVYYYLKNKPKEDVKIEILDAKGGLVKAFSSKGEQREEGESSFGGRGGQERVPADSGMNRFTWDLRYPDAIITPGALLWAGTTRGPLCVPGMYQVRLIVDGKSYTQPLEVKKDPRLETTAEEFQTQFDLSMKVRDKVSDAHTAVNAIRDTRKQFEELTKRTKNHETGKSIAEAAKALDKKLSAIEEEIIQVKIKSNQDALNFPIKLNNKIASLQSLIQGSDSRPTKQTADVFADLSSQLDEQLARLKKVTDTDVPEFNNLVKGLNVPAVLLKGEKKGE
jgi:photosystem II stability/assembly factor-like uncharacterized protein